MTKRRSGLTAGEIINKNLADPAFVARMQEQERLRLEKAKVLMEAEVPLVEALKRVGCIVKSSWDLVNTKAKYPEAIPVLLEHLQKDYPVEIRAGIARALAVPEARIGRDIIVEQYRKLPDTKKQGLKQGLAAAVVGTTTESDIDEVIDLIEDPAHGDSRGLLLLALKRSKTEAARQEIEKLRHDPLFAAEIGSWRKKPSRG